MNLGTDKGFQAVQLANSILELCRDKGGTRDDVAVLYARMIYLEQAFGVRFANWQDLNDQIVRAWSVSALEYIKKKAWRYNTPTK